MDLTSRMPRLSWLNGKTHPQGNGGRKGISGHLPEHTDSLVENGSRTFAAEVDKVFNVSVTKNETLLGAIPDEPTTL